MNGSIPILFEQFQGAFEHKFPKVPASIYILSGEDFYQAQEKYGKDKWREDFVSETLVLTKEEIKIPNARSFVMNLITQGEIQLVRNDNQKQNTLKD